jgi:hypothetical protein
VTSRWDTPWTAPTGLAPERPPGEPSFGVLALVHLAVFFGLSALGGLTQVASGIGQAATSYLLAVVVGGVGWGVWVQRTPLGAWVSDVLLAASAAYLFVGTQYVVSGSLGVLVGSGVALAYALHRRVWLQVAVTAAAVGMLLGALGLRPEVPDAVYGVYLLVLAGFLALLTASGLSRPVASGYVLAALLATAGAEVLVTVDAAGGSAVAVLVLGAVVAGVLRSGNRSLLPVVVLAGVLLVPQPLAPALGGWRAFGLSLSATAAASAWLAVDLQRRTPRPVHIGGIMAVSLGLLLLSEPFQLAGTDHDATADLLHAFTLIAFFGAAAAGRRRPATVVSGFLVVTTAPSALALGSGASSLAALVLLAGVVVVAVQADKRAPRPAAAPFQREQALTGPGKEWTLQVPYAQAFDALVVELGSAGVPLQLVDRAAGRVIAGDPVVPWLTVALWSDDPLRTRVRAVGPPWNVEHLEQQLANRLAVPH